MESCKKEPLESRVLTPAQFGLLRRAERMGKELLAYPEIAEMYRKGMIVREIVEQLGSSQEIDLGVHSDLSKLAVYFALRGTPEYEGLLPEEERRRIAQQNRTLASKAHGFELLSSGRGIFTRTKEEMSEHGLSILNAMTPEERKEMAIKGGTRSYLLGKGCHALTLSERRKAARKGALSRGCVPWVQKKELLDSGASCLVPELESAYRLSQQEDFLWVEGPQKGKPKGSKIAEHLNQHYHGGRNVRTGAIVSSRLGEYRKKLCGE